MTTGDMHFIGGLIVVALGGLWSYHGVNLNQTKFANNIIGQAQKTGDNIIESQKDGFEDAEKDRKGKHSEVMEKLEEKAETKIELDKIKAPRTLSHEQQNRIINKIEEFHGTTFVVMTYPGQPEAVEFSNAIANILVRAGWNLNPNNSRGTLLGSASGVVVVVGRQAGAKAEKKGKALLEALVSEGILAKLGYGSLQINPIAIEIKIQVANKEHHL